MRSDIFLWWFSMGGCKDPEVEMCLLYSETSRRLVHLECMRWVEISGDEFRKVRVGRGEPFRGLGGHCKDFGFYIEG